MHMLISWCAWFPSSIHHRPHILITVDLITAVDLPDRSDRLLAITADVMSAWLRAAKQVEVGADALSMGFHWAARRNHHAHPWNPSTPILGEGTDSLLCHHC